VSASRQRNEPEEQQRRALGDLHGFGAGRHLAVADEKLEDPVVEREQRRLDGGGQINGRGLVDRRSLIAAFLMSCRAETCPGGNSSTRSCSRTPWRRCPVTVADTRTATVTPASRSACRIGPHHRDEV
jgi:hypothetical protein